MLLVAIGLAASVQATLVAYEGFRTTEALDDYDAGALSGQSPVVGNSGFASNLLWYGNTGAMSANVGALTLSALVQSGESGQVALGGYSSGRGSSRSLAADPVSSATYYLSGLVNLNSSGRLQDGEYRAAGFMGSLVGGTTVSLADGMHYGVRNEGDVYYLAAFAGGNIYNIAELPVFATTYQVVLKLDVSDAGSESLSAWYAADGDAQLTEGFSGISVETWSGITDLKRLSVQTSGVSTYATLPTYFDEIYLGTALADVTSLTEPVPGLVAYEDFDYAGGASLTAEATNGGTGWAADWKAATGVAASHTTSGTCKSLHFGQSPDLVAGNGTHVWTESEKGNQRDYSSAIDLTTESLYLTALVRAYAGTSSGGASEADLRFELFDGAGATGNMRANVGISDGTLFASAATDGYLAGDTNANAFADNTTYLMVMKRDGNGIHASLIEADGLYSTLESEPVSWQVTESGATGADLKSIRMLTDGDGDGGLRVDELRIATSWSTAIGSLVVLPSTNELIASESFKTTASTDDYTDGSTLGSVENKDIVEGNLGFSASKTWQPSTGALILDGAEELTHSAVVGSVFSGSLQIKPQSNLDRNSKRLLEEVPAGAGSYFLSALVYLGDVNDIRDGDYVALGMMNDIALSTASVATGMHLGFRRESSVVYLSAFAGGNAYDLLTLDSGTVTNTYQVVLQLDVQAGDAEALSAWYANDGDTNLTQALSGVSVETWATINDLKTLVAQEHSSVSVLTPGAHFDEFRFGSTLASVTAYTLPEGPSIENMQMVLNGADVVVCWQSNGEGSFALQRKEDLVSDIWSNIVQGITGYAGEICITNTTDFPQAFYRVVAE